MNKHWTVIDLFSGAGGMSYGFHVHPKFEIVGAVDAQIGQPSSDRGSLRCNVAYQANMGLGYQVHRKNYLLNRFGLPQCGERALVIAVREDLTLRALEDLWSGFRVSVETSLSCCLFIL